MRISDWSSDVCSSDLRPLRAQPAPVRSAAPPLSAHTLDGSWDRRIAGGQVVPDLTVDLHGHNLNSAHALLERRLGEAIAHGQRVLLVITGRPPRPDQHPTRPPGPLPPTLHHWIAASPNPSAHAAFRAPHPPPGRPSTRYLALPRNPD